MSEVSGMMRTDVVRGKKKQRGECGGISTRGDAAACREWSEGLCVQVCCLVG